MEVDMSGNSARDRILIEDLAARCVIGLDDEERREKQDVRVSLALWTDLAPAARSDRVEDALDYRALKKKVLRLVEDSRFYLIEALAEAVAEACLAEPKVARVEVRVEKPSALRFARTVAVEITRPAPPRE
jgi:FolB domain-containing protein